MSRSRRKTPIFGITTSESEKRFKQHEHQRERAAVRSVLRDEPEVLPDPKEFGNPWGGPKDGKLYWKGAKPSNMRK